MTEVDAETLNQIAFVVDVLVEGLLGRDAELIRRCGAGLHSLGWLTVSRVEAVMESGSYSEGDQAKLQQIVRYLRHTPFVGDWIRTVRDALIYALRSPDREFRGHVEKALEHWGSDVVEVLIDEAIDNMSSPRLCVRLLRAAEETGRVPRSQTQMDLLIASSLARSATVKQAFVQLMTSIRFHTRASAAS